MSGHVAGKGVRSATTYAGRQNRCPKVKDDGMKCLNILPIDLTEIAFPSSSKTGSVNSISHSYPKSTQYPERQTCSVGMNYTTQKHPSSTCLPTFEPCIPQVGNARPTAWHQKRISEPQSNAKPSSRCDRPCAHFLLPWPKRNPFPFSAHPLSSGLGDERPWWSSETAEPFLASSLAAWASSPLNTFPVPPRPTCVAPWLGRRVTLRCH